MIYQNAKFRLESSLSPSSLSPSNLSPSNLSPGSDGKPTLAIRLVGSVNEDLAGVNLVALVGAEAGKSDGARIAIVPQVLGLPGTRVEAFQAPYYCMRCKLRQVITLKPADQDLVKG